MNEKLVKKFSKIYEKGLWGNKSEEFMKNRKNKKFYSGGGTVLENDKEEKYRKLIQEYVNKEDVKTVIEIGCGDWEVSSYIDWSSVDYCGYDVVPELIKYNKENFSKKNIKFLCKDVFKDKDIKGDLIIIKDVIQHLPPIYCAEFVSEIPNNFKYNIITNDSGGNVKIDFGGYTGNNFSIHPFNIKNKILFNWHQKFKEAGNKQTLTLGV